MLAAVEYLKIHHNEKLWVESDFEAVSGIGVNVTEGELQDFVNKYMSAHKDKILEERYKALPSTLKEISANSLIKWADPKLRTEVVSRKFEDLLGPKDERDNVPSKKAVLFSYCLLNVRRKRSQEPQIPLSTNPLLEQLKKYFQKCSPKDGWEIYTNQAEILRLHPSSWKPISPQQAEK